jgi:hypothetical protein
MLKATKYNIISLYFLFRVQSRNTLHLITVPWQQQLRFYADFPAHIRVAFPAFSPTMTVGAIVMWHKKEGKAVYNNVTTYDSCENIKLYVLDQVSILCFYP